MADLELRFVSKIIRAGDIKPAIERGVTAEWFENEDARDIWRFLFRYFNEYGDVPSVSTVKQSLYGATVLDVQDSYDFFLDQMTHQRKRRMVTEAAEKIIESLDSDDPDGALDIMGSLSLEIDAVGAATNDVDLTKTVDERLARYEEYKKFKGRLRGWPTGFPTIDQATQGLQPEQLVVLVAPPKGGKSTIVMKAARSVHEAGGVPMVISFEMSNAEQEARHDAMTASISHKRLLSGDMNMHDERLLRRKLEREKEKQSFYLIDDPGSTSTVAGVAAKIQNYKPDVCFIDGVYFMQDMHGQPSGSPMAITNITRDLKRLAKKTGIPIFITTQALIWKMKGKKSVEADSAGYASSFGQDADVMFGLELVDPDDKTNQERLLKVVLSRASGYKEVTLAFDWDTATFKEVADTLDPK